MTSEIRWQDMRLPRLLMSFEDRPTSYVTTSYFSRTLPVPERYSSAASRLVDHFILATSVDSHLLQFQTQPIRMSIRDHQEESDPGLGYSVSTAKWIPQKLVFSTLSLAPGGIHLCCPVCRTSTSTHLCRLALHSFQVSSGGHGLSTLLPAFGPSGTQHDPPTSLICLPVDLYALGHP